MEKFEQIEEKKLAELAENPYNIVYRYKSSPALDPSEIVPLDVVASNIEDLYREYDALRKKQSNLTAQNWGRIKQYLLKNPRWRKFEYSHPLFVQRIIAPETVRKDIDAMLFLIELNRQALAGKIVSDEAKKLLGFYMLKTFGQTEAEYLASCKERNQTPVSYTISGQGQK